MGMELGEFVVGREEHPGTRVVSIFLSRLASEALSRGAESGADVATRMRSALRCYIGDRGTERPAWRYPAFLRGTETPSEVRVEVEVEDGLWRSFEEEAAAQDVSVEQLVEHAAFYFTAEADAGRLTERILEDLDAGSGAGQGQDAAGGL